MARRMFVATGAALILAVGLGCAQTGSTVSPSVASPGGDAAPDGSTLKATQPGLVSPTGGERTETTDPVFVITNSTGKFIAATFDYRIWVQDPSGSFVYNSPKLGAGSNGQTSWQIPVDLDLDSPYQWRARAEIGSNYGPWSDFGDFLTIDYRGLVPRPPNGNWPSDPDGVIAYISAVFPEYLSATPTVGERIANMLFLRDRIIEAGICGGIDLALNLKRGIGPHSTDAIAWRTSSGDVEVVDIAAAFDDNDFDMSLHWQIVEGPPGYDPYPNHPGC